MKLEIYNQLGEKTAEQVELPAKIFTVPNVKPEVVHQIVVSILSSRRNTVAHTKTKGEVRGGGRKPWKQKGTGRARHGSIRSPLWKGGGVTFGPRSNRNFHKKINKKMAKVAIVSVLTDRSKAGRIWILNKLDIEQGKTKEMKNFIKEFRGGTGGENEKFAVILPRKDEKIVKAARNFKNVRIRSVDNLNILDLLWANFIVILKEALEVLEKKYGNSQ